MRNVVIFTIFLLLAACQSTPYPVSSPYFRIPPGSKLILKQALTIPPNAGRVYIQYGKVVTPKEKDNWHAHCWFLSWNVSDRPQVIRPDTFIITSSQHLEDMVSRHTDYLYARNGPGIGINEGGGPTALIYTTEMHIRSDMQPAIRRFACSHWENPNDAQHLTVAEMQKALGNIARIELNTGK